jgi:PAS domain S-box-containing protein
MNLQFSLYIFLPLGAALIALALVLFSLRRRPARGFGAFFVFTVGIVIWSLGYALELADADLTMQVLYAKIEYLGIVGVPTGWCLFVALYTQSIKRLSFRATLAFLLEPMIILALAWTNEWHHLIWATTGQTQLETIRVLDLTHGPAFWVHVVYVYGLLVIATIWLLQASARTRNLYREQARALGLAALAPWLGNALYLFGWIQLDLTPFAFAFAGAIFGFGVLRFRLFDVIPMARAAVMASMRDVVVVLDPEGRIAEMNSAAQRLTGWDAQIVLGQPASRILADLPQVVEHIRDTQEISTEITAHVNRQTRVFELRIVPLSNARQARAAGRLIVLHDITEHKQTEEALRASEMQQRAVLDALPDSIFTLDSTGKFLDFHASDPTSLIVPPQRFLNHTLREVLPLAVAQALRAKIERALQSDSVEVLEFPLTLDGKARIFEARITPSGDEHVIALVRDITLRKKQEAELERRLRETTLLNRVISAATSARELEQVLRIVCSELAVGLNVPQVRATLLDPSKTGLRIVAEYCPYDVPSAVGEIIPLANNPSSQYVLDHHAPLAVADVATDPRMQSVSDLMQKYRVASILIVPVWIRDQIAGTFGLDSFVRREFTTEEISLAQSVAAAVSQALENANLLESANRELEQRKRAEAELKRSEERYREIVTNANDIIYRADANGHFNYYNPTATKLLGYNESELMGRHYLDLIRADHRKQARAFYRRQLGSRMPNTYYEVPIVCKDGSTIWLGQNVQLFFENDKIAGFQSVARDVTERHRAEDALRYRSKFEELVTSISTNFINLTLEEADSGIQRALQSIGEFAQVDRSYIFMFADDGAKMSNTHEWCAPGIAPHIGNLQNHSTVTLPWWMAKLRNLETIHIQRADDLPAEARAEQAIMQAQGIRSLVAVPLARRKSLIGYMGFDTLRSEKSWSADDIVLLKIVGEIVVNALERKRVQAELRQERDFALQVMNTMGQGLTVTDERGCFEFVNPAYARMIGYAPQDLIGQTPDAVTFDEDRAALDEARKQRQVGVTTTYETRLKRADGGVVHALITGVPRWQDGRLGTIAVITDLTERKRAEEQLARARDQAMEASRLKSEFLATMSHEIRTPMNSIIGMSEMLLGENLNAESREFAGVIHQSATALLTIINDILDFSKIEAGKLILDHTDFDLVSVIEGGVELLATKAREKNLALMSFVPPDIPRWLHGDPGRLRQVLVNLIGNAVKFTANGQVMVRVDLESQSETNVCLRFAVQDTGIGISETARRRLFQAFTQADGSTTRKYGGTGLGLAISKRLVEMMKGEIGVESEEGRGATFWFTTRFEFAQSAKSPQADLRGLRVLIVDDIPSHREIVARYVNSWGMQSHMCESGKDALEELRRAEHTTAPYDLAVLDMAMPEMDGWTLAREIQHDAAIARTHLILLTAFDERGKGETALRAGFGAYLTKPIRQSNLYDAIVHVMTMPPSIVNQPAIAPLAPVAPPALTRILLAEDNPINQKVATLQLDRLGYAVNIVANGHAAVQAILDDQETYGAILMDCQMPEMDGFDATRAIRKAELKSGKHVPIIAMTANALEGDRDRCIAAGMDDYISKPVNLDGLRRVLEHWSMQKDGATK